MAHLEPVKSLDGCFTLTFINKTDLSEDNIRELFEKCGPVFSINRPNGPSRRYFVKYKDYDSAKRALIDYHVEYGVELPLSSKKPQINANREFVGNNSKTPTSPRYSEEQGQRRFDSAQSSQAQSSQTHHFHNRSDSSEMNVVSKRSIRCTQDAPPPLIDAAGSKSKPLCLVLGNLPNHFTVEDAYMLTSEVLPVSLNDVDITAGCKLKYCLIYLDTFKKLKYLIDKLDGFVLGGKKLIAIELTFLLTSTNTLKLA